MQLYASMSVGSFYVTLRLFSKSVIHYRLVTMKLLWIVNFHMKLCRGSDSDVVALFICFLVFLKVA